MKKIGFRLPDRFTFNNQKPPTTNTSTLCRQQRIGLPLSVGSFLHCCCCAYDDDSPTFVRVFQIYPVFSAFLLSLPRTYSLTLSFPLPQLSALPPLSSRSLLIRACVCVSLCMCVCGCHSFVNTLVSKSSPLFCSVVFRFDFVFVRLWQCLNSPCACVCVRVSLLGCCFEFSSRILCGWSGLLELVTSSTHKLQKKLENCDAAFLYSSAEL